MRKIGQILLFSVLLLGLSACYPGGFSFGNETVRLRESGEIETMEYDFSDFDVVEASYTFDVDIQYADAYSVVVRADAEIVEYLDVSMMRSRLHLGLKSGYNYNFSNVTLEADVRMPSLARVALSGASSAYLSGFESRDSLHVDLSGSSDVYGDIIAGNANFDLSGASEIELYGSCASLDIDASGSSVVDLTDFYAENVDVFASGASDVKVWTDGRLNVDASGDSDVYYEGDADLGSINTSGTSSVRER
jgi:hypothetical protein